jgi:hypothetical protein
MLSPFVPRPARLGGWAVFQMIVTLGLSGGVIAVPRLLTSLGLDPAHFLLIEAIVLPTWAGLRLAYVLEEDETPRFEMAYHSSNCLSCHDGTAETPKEHFRIAITNTSRTPFKAASLRVVEPLPSHVYEGNLSIVGDQAADEYTFYPDTPKHFAIVKRHPGTGPAFEIAYAAGQFRNPVLTDSRQITLRLRLLGYKPDYTFQMTPDGPVVNAVTSRP